MNDYDKRNSLIIGSLLGAITGLFAAFLMVRRAEENETSIPVTTGEGFRLGMLVIGFLREIAK